jgi:hypothetical protein
MQRKLDTIQKKAKLNEVWTIGEPGPGDAYHDYIIVSGKNPQYDFEEWPRQIILQVSFQEGPRNAQGSHTGVLDADLLEIVRDRLKAFQKGDMATEYNAQALMHIEKALKLMNMRVEDRIKRGVLGTMKK